MNYSNKNTLQLIASLKISNVSNFYITKYIYFFITHNRPQKVLVIPRNRWLRLNMTENFFTWTLNKNQNKTKTTVHRLFNKLLLFSWFMSEKHLNLVAEIMKLE